MTDRTPATPPPASADAMGEVEHSSEDDVITEIMVKAYMRRGGLSEWDREFVEGDVRSIRKTLTKRGYEIVKRSSS
jgi:hypothetical protein